MTRATFIAIAILLSPTAALARGMSLPTWLDRDQAAQAPAAALPPANQPVERTPGFSEPSLEFRLDSQGRHVITRIDRDNDTVKEWVKDGVISEAQIQSVESGKAVTIEIPDAH